MADTPESISYIKIGNEEHPIDAVTVGGKTVELISVEEVYSLWDSN